jgi:2-keto-4-pentenoate hydratase
MEEAYAVQAVVAAGESVRGWKIGCTSVEAQQVVGVAEPIAGRLYGRDCHHIPAVLQGVRGDMSFVEAEFAFHFAEPLDARSRPVTRAEVLSAADAIHPAVELVQSRFRDWRAASAWETVADNSGHGALILGPPTPSWQSLDLPRHEVRLLLEGEVLACGCGARVLGDPLNCLLWLAAFLGRRNEWVRPGDYVTTGTCIGVPSVPLAEPLVADFGALGTVQIKLTSAGRELETTPGPYEQTS